MFKVINKVPSYVYLATLIGGAAVTYIFYPIGKEKKKNNKNPRGLINCKNDCFINVILQSLAASDKVTEWLVNNKTTSNSLFNTLADIIIRINRLESVEDEKLNILIENNDQYEFYAAQSFKRALNAHNWSIKSEEHDCHELFQLIMDVLDEEQIESKKSMKSLNYFTSSLLKGSSRLSGSKNSFHGYFVNQLQCLDCNYKYPLRLESFYSLSLTLPNQQYGIRNSVTLTECINNYFKSDHITGMKCENCHREDTNKQFDTEKSKGFIKRQAIAKLPECLSIQIQRNSWSDNGHGMIKQTNYVQFPEYIKIDSPVSTLQNNPQAKSNNLSNLFSQYSNNQFSLKQVGIGGLLGGNNTNKSKLSATPLKKSLVLTPNQNQQKFQQYELKSAIIHYGSAHSGHFVTYRKPLKPSVNPEYADDWLQISDSDIKRCKPYQLFSSNVYMLFYDKVPINSAV